MNDKNVVTEKEGKNPEADTDNSFVVAAGLVAILYGLKCIKDTLCKAIDHGYDARMKVKKHGKLCLTSREKRDDGQESKAAVDKPPKELPVSDKAEMAT